MPGRAAGASRAGIATAAPIVIAAAAPIASRSVRAGWFLIAGGRCAAKRSDIAGVPSLPVRTSGRGRWCASVGRYSGWFHHHQRPGGCTTRDRPHEGPHHGPHDRRLAWAGRDGAGGRAWLTLVQVRPALCQVVVWRGAGPWRGCPAMVEQLALGFGGLLRQLRAGAGLTQEELAEAAGLSPRSVSDLERGIHPTARKDTAELLAGVLGLAGPARPLFVAAARGRVPPGQVLAALRGEAVPVGCARLRG